MPMVNNNSSNSSHNNTIDYNKQRNDMLAIIAGSLSKIEGHLSRISKVASSLYGQTMNNNNDPIDHNNVSNSSSISVSSNNMNMNNSSSSDVNNNNVNMSSNEAGGGVITSHGSQES